jgi:hypothetical protein
MERHYLDRMAETGHSKHRPKITLRSIEAARLYHDALAAAEAARGRLVQVAVGKAPDRRAALTVLNHLAESFGFPGFTAREVAAAEKPGS